MVNFGILAAEIVSLVWGTPANFNGFCVLAALLHGTLVVGVRQTAAFNRGHHLYSAGRPSGWALAHISSSIFFSSPNLSGRRLDAYHTFTHGVALVRISNPCLMHDVWPSPGLVHYICTFFGGSCLLTEFCQVPHSLYVQVLRSPILAALRHGTPAVGVSQTLRRDTRNGITELSHRAPPIFGRAAITLVIGPHSPNDYILEP